MRIFRYFCVGGIAATVDIGLYAIFAYLLEFNYLLVAACSFFLATLVNYLLSIRYVFTSGMRFAMRDEILLIFVVSGIGLLVNQVILYISVEYLLLDKLLAKLLATAAVFLWNYLCRARYVFAARDETS